MGTGESGDGPLRKKRQERIHRQWGKKKSQGRVGQDGMRSK